MIRRRPGRILLLSKICLAFTLVMLPVLVLVATRLSVGSSEVTAWLSKDSQVYVEYRDFLNQFGHDQTLLVSWTGCTLEDARLSEVAKRLSQEFLRSSELPVASLDNSAFQIERLARDFRITAAEARRRLSGVSVGSDGSAFILIQLGERSGPHLPKLLSIVRECAAGCGIPESELLLAGEPFQTYCIDQASRRAVQNLVLPSTLIALLVAWFCVREFGLTVIVLSFAGIGHLTGLAIISLVLGRMSTVLIVMPTLIFMLTLSAAVHLVNYYRDAAASTPDDAPIRAFGMGVRPCLFATLTTACGFLSLGTSNLAPVWQFGFLSALGLTLSTVCLLFSFPAACWLAASFKQISVRRHGNQKSERKAQVQLARDSLRQGFETWLARFTRSNAGTLSVLGVVLLVLAAMGLSRLRSATEFDSLFPAESTAVASLHWVEQHLGPLETLELLVRLPVSESTRGEELLDRLRFLHVLQAKWSALPQAYKVFSAASMLPAVPTGSGAGSTIRRAVLKRKVADNLPNIEDGGWLNAIEGAEIWRFSVRVDPLSTEEFRMVQASVRHAFELVRQTCGLPVGQLASLRITGYQTVANRARQALLSDLATSFALAFVLITPVMMLIGRGILSGLVVMLPSLVPVVLVFGGMGWLGIRLDVASILTASVALGIAVDDTLHLISWYLRERRSGNPPELAVQRAIQTCARPMLTTTMICSGAMLPFFFSEFLPTSRFALLMILILIGALVGDLVLLPALLQTRLGRLVGGRGAAVTEVGSHVP